MKHLFQWSTSIFVLSGALAVPAFAQQPAASSRQVAPNGAAPTGVALPAGYLIGPEDVLSVVFWKDKELSGEFVVRPDGKISMPLLNDIVAAGLTPDQLREEILKAASKYMEEPTAAVVVREIRSRRVFISGQIAKPGPYMLIGDKTIAQLIAEAGGLLEYADAKKIVIHRETEGKTQRFTFNYRDFTKGKNLQQNIALKPGDLVIVP